MKIAVIGIGCRYPGAASAKEFFENLLAGRRGFRHVPPERWPLEGYYHPDKSHPDTTYCKKAAFVENFQFDPAAFRIPRQTFLATDTAQWMALKVAQDALQDAGIDPELNQRTGVIIGNTLTGEVSRASVLRYRWPYVKKIFSELLDNFSIQGAERAIILEKVEARYKAPFPPVNEDNLAGGLSNTIAGRICNYFDFKGGGFATDGACSSSLLAINQACIGLVNDNCDIALAGGVDISIDPFEVVGFAKVGALSNTDIRVYDQNSNGFIPGEGCGIVVLQRYEDAVKQGKSIYAVINGIGISSDGKGGITAPNVSGQLLAVNQAYNMAEYDFAAVEMIEGHGTGTPTGDRVELTTFLESKKGSHPAAGHRCGIGSIKSNIGHTKAAAGVAGFIKAVMSVCYGVMPATLGIRTPNELFKAGPYLYPLLQGRRWSPSVESRKAAVSSAGFGGINTHITVSSADAALTRALPAESDLYARLTCTAQSSELIVVTGADLVDLRKNLAEVLAAARRMSEAELIDLSICCFQTYRIDRYRLAVVVESAEQLAEKLVSVAAILDGANPPSRIIDRKNEIYLSSEISAPRITYLFPGQASQQLNMGKLLKERCSSAQAVWTAADQLVECELGNISDLVFRDTDAATSDELAQWRTVINETSVTQPAVTIASIAALAFLRDLGIRPDMAIGHSLGEYAALYSAGVLDLKQTMQLVAVRGKAMASASGVPGAMVSIGAPQSVVQELIGRVKTEMDGELVISNINSPKQTVVSGEVALVNRGVQLAIAQGLQVNQLPVSTAFHSRLMSSAAEIMGPALASTTFKRSRHLVISPTTGAFVDDRCHFADLLVKQILGPVDFVRALELAVQEETDLLVEVGPGGALANLATQTLEEKAPLICTTDLGERGQYSQGINRLVAYLFACGVPLNHQVLFQGRFFRPLSLPYAVNIIASPCETPVAPLDLMVDGNVVISGTFAPPDEGAASVRREANLKGASVDLNEVDGILEFLKQQIVRGFGYSYEMLSPSSLLSDDLGLDSLKSVELAHEALAVLGLRADVTKMQNASLQELAEFIFKLKRGSANDSSGTDPKIANAMPEWVRAFRSTAQRADAAPGRGRPRGRYLIVHEQNDSFVEVLEAALVRNAVQVDRLLAQVAIEANPSLQLYTGCVYLINGAGRAPATRAGTGPIEAHLQRPKMLLHAAKILLHSASAKDRLFMLAAVPGVPLWRSSEAAVASEAGAGFIKTLHLEHPNLSSRCVDFAAGVDPQSWSQALLAEMIHDGQHLDASYDAEGGRYIQTFEKIEPVLLPPPKSPLGRGDVLVITGGAKGITAECALALGRALPITIALVGSSPLPTQDESPNELANNLRRFAAAEIPHKYYACDVLDAAAVDQLFHTIGRELGTVTAILHAAGVNGIQKIISADWNAFQQVLLPKMQGLLNLANAANLDQLKSFNVFSSVIANSGMAGNAEYAYANEWMNGFVQELSQRYPQMDCRAFGFSVWADVGMGARLNSVERLGHMGVGAIPLAAGTQAFVSLMQQGWNTTNLIISARMGQLDTLRFARYPVPAKRFTQKILSLQPGIELTAEVDLNPAMDLFLLDHIYEGSALFPAVMGIEAMIQCASLCLESSGVTPEALPELSNLTFSRAIIVPPEGRTIRISVQMTDLDSAMERRAHIAIRSSVSDFNLDYFTGDCVWKPAWAEGERRTSLPQSSYLELDPSKDLYGKILFQGSMFRNLTGYRELSAKHCVAKVRVPVGSGLFSGQGPEFEVIYGAGEVRDTFLHAVQLCVPQYRILPVSIENIRSRGFGGADGVDKSLTLYARERMRIDDEFIYDLEIYDSLGRCVELIVGFRCRIMGDYGDQENLAKIYRAHEQSTELSKLKIVNEENKLLIRDAG